MDERTVKLIEETFEITISDKNKRILITSTGLLGPYEKQERFLLGIALAPRECPACLSTICQMSASPGGTIDFMADQGSDRDYQCPRCDTRLQWHLGLAGDTWFSLDPSEARPVKRER